MNNRHIGWVTRGGLMILCVASILATSAAAHVPEGSTNDPKASVVELFESGKELARARQKPCRPACAVDQVCVRGRCVPAGPPGSQCEPACAPGELCVGPMGERSCCRRDNLCKGICYTGPVPRCQGEHCCPDSETCCG